MSFIIQYFTIIINVFRFSFIIFFSFYCMMNELRCNVLNKCKIKITWVILEFIHQKVQNTMSEIQQTSISSHHGPISQDDRTTQTCMSSIFKIDYPAYDVYCRSAIAKPPRLGDFMHKDDNYFSDNASETVNFCLFCWIYSCKYFFNIWYLINVALTPRTLMYFPIELYNFRYGALIQNDLMFQITVLWNKLNCYSSEYLFVLIWPTIKMYNYTCKILILNTL